MDDFMNGFMRIIGWVILYFLWKFFKGFFGNIKNVIEEKPEEKVASTVNGKYDENAVERGKRYSFDEYALRATRYGSTSHPGKSQILDLEETDHQERLGYTTNDDYREYQAYSEYGQSQVYETSETSGISGISGKNEMSKANEQKADELREKPNKNEQIFETSVDPIKENNNDFFLSLTEQSLINSIIMSEVLGPSKAKRKLDAC